jgi:hypothetical protein
MYFHHSAYSVALIWIYDMLNITVLIITKFKRCIPIYYEVIVRFIYGHFCQYLMWPPFALRTAWILLGIDSISFWHLSLGMALHSWTNRFQSSLDDLGMVGYLAKAALAWNLRFSIGFRSGYCKGHCKTLIPLSFHISGFTSDVLWVIIIPFLMSIKHQNTANPEPQINGLHHCTPIWCNERYTLCYFSYSGSQKCPQKSNFNVISSELIQLCWFEYMIC